MLADEGDFQTHPSEAQCLRCIPNRRLRFVAKVASVLQLHSETSHYHSHGCHLNISWTRCADIDWAEGICHVLSTLFTQTSCGRAHLCWQRTRWEDVIQSVLLRFSDTIFIPNVDSAALEWHYSSISMLNHLYSAGLEVDLHLNLFPAHVNYTSMLITTGPHTVWQDTVHIWRGMCIFVTSFHRGIKKLCLTHNSASQVDHTEKHLFFVSLEAQFQLPPGII